MKKIGLALSGGGVKGLAHIGVIKTLVENNISIDYIAGTSIGAFVGGLYAATKDITLLEKIATTNNWKEIFSLFFDPGFKGGLITGKKVITFIEKYIGKVDFHSLKIPFTAVATDFCTGQAVSINKGQLCQAIKASIAIPVFFQPEIINNQILFDGGLSSPYPVNIVKKMGADIVIGVNLYDNYLANFSSKNLRLVPLLGQSLKIFLHNLSKNEADKADITISPMFPKISWQKLLDKRGSFEGINLGSLEALAKIKEIKTLISTSSLWDKIKLLLKPYPYDQHKQNLNP